MYNPASFRQDCTANLHELIQARPLGLLVTNGSSGLQASPLPLLLYREEGELGVLRAHMARANGHWRDLAGLDECLVVFQGVDGYVTPSWYQSKAVAHQVVPTWNYAAVQAWGRPSTVADPAWLGRQVEDLTDHHEQRRPRPWALGDAPADYIAAQMKAIVGIEIALNRIEGKYKMSQNRPAADRDGVIAGMQDESDPHCNPDVASFMRSV